MNRIIGYTVDGQTTCRDCLPHAQTPQSEGEPLLDDVPEWKGIRCNICGDTLGRADADSWREVSDKTLLAAFSVIVPGAADGMVLARGTVGVSLDFLRALLSECLAHDVNDEWSRSAIANLRAVIDEV